MIIEQDVDLTQPARSYQFFARHEIHPLRGQIGLELDDDGGTAPPSTYRLSVIIAGAGEIARIGAGMEGPATAFRQELRTMILARLEAAEWQVAIADWDSDRRPGAWFTIGDVTAPWPLVWHLITIETRVTYKYAVLAQSDEDAMQRVADKAVAVAIGYEEIREPGPGVSLALSGSLQSVEQHPRAHITHYMGDTEEVLSLEEWKKLHGERAT